MCASVTCCAIFLSRDGAGLSRKIKMQSKREARASGSPILSETLLLSSQREESGFAAARTVVYARKVAATPALAIETVYYSNAS